MAGPSDWNKIHLAGDCRILELAASDGSGDAVIVPGMLLLQNGLNSVIPHNVSGGNAERLVAQEDSLQGGTINTAYIAANPVRIAAEKPGNLSLMLVQSGAYAAGTFLMSNGDGTLVTLSGSNHAVAVVVNDLDITDSADMSAVLAQVRVV